MKRAAWVIVIALWVCIFASSFFTRIEADDYCFASVVEDTGIVGSLGHWYSTWAGRFSQQFAHGVFAAIEPYGARVGVPVMLTGVIVAWWYALAHWYKRSDALFLALALGAALAVSRPNDEPIYWLAGITSYWLPFVGVGVLVGALVRRRTPLAALAGFATVGLSETGGALLIVGLGLAFLIWKGERRRILVVLASALVGFLIVYLAPGNDVRRAAFIPVELTPYYVLRVAVAGFATNAGVSFVISIVPGLFLSGVGALLPPPFSVRRLPLLFLLLALGASMLLALVAVVANGWGLGLRAIYLLVPLWLAQWYFLGVVIGGCFPLWRGMVLIGALLLVGAVQHVAARIDYARQWDARHEAILAGYRVLGDIGSWDTLTDTEWALACAEGWYDREIRFVDAMNVP